MVMQRQVRIAVLGAGLIGQKHIQHVSREAVLHAIVDPAPEAEMIANQYSTNWFSSLADLLATDRPDGIIIATPTQMHVENAFECIAAGIPVLIEKPIADDVVEAQRLVDMAQAANVAILVGHHRRHNPVIRKAKELISGGSLGELVSINAMCWLFKPESYFGVSWRSRKGAGPVLTNLIHDVDLLRYLCGDIVRVQAELSSAIRGKQIEDTAVILLKFVNGALGTMTVSDTIVAPWSWELTAGENAAYPHTNQSCYMFGGTRGSLSLPDLGIWHNRTQPDWWEPLSRDTEIFESGDPLAIQIGHFCDVVEGKSKPHVNGHEGLETLRVIEAIGQAAEKQSPVNLTRREGEPA